MFVLCLDPFTSHNSFNPSPPRQEEETRGSDEPRSPGLVTTGIEARQHRFFVPSIEVLVCLHFEYLEGDGRDDPDRLAW